VRQQEAIIKRKIIRAPFNGLLGIRQVNLGQYIEAGDAIISLQALDPIYVDYTLPEIYTTQVSAGQTVKLKLDAVPDRTFTGEVSAVNTGIDTGTRTLKVRAMLDNPDSVLRPGMFAEVQTIIAEAKPVLTLPATAVSVNTYGNFVFVVNKGADGKLMVKRTAVELGDSIDGRVIVTSLEAGIEVVRTGLVKLRDGMPVKVDNQVKLDDATISGE
jgi:membrane fusion protein (multidrug efflux system)